MLGCCWVQRNQVLKVLDICSVACELNDQMSWFSRNVIDFGDFLRVWKVTFLWLIKIPFNIARLALAVKLHHDVSPGNFVQHTEVVIAGEFAFYWLFPWCQGDSDRVLVVRVNFVWEDYQGQRLILVYVAHVVYSLGLCLTKEMLWLEDIGSLCWWGHINWNTSGH